MLSEKTEEISRQLEQVKQLEVKITSLEDQAACNAAEYAAMVTAVKDELKVLQALVVASDEQIVELKTTIQGQDQTITEARSLREELEGKLSLLSEEKEKDAQDASQTIANLASLKQELEKQLADNEATAGERIASLEQTLTTTQAAHDETLSKLQSVESEVQSLQNNRAELEKKIDLLDKEREELEQQLTNASCEHSELEQKLEDIAKEHLDMERKIEELENKNSFLDKERSLLEINLQESRSMLEQQYTELTACKHDLRASEEKILQLHSTLEQHIRHGEELRKGQERTQEIARTLEAEYRKASINMKMLEADKMQLLLQQEILLLACDLKGDAASLSRLMAEKLALERRLSSVLVRSEASNKDIVRLSQELEQVTTTFKLYREKSEEKVIALQSDLEKSVNDVRGLEDQLISLKTLLSQQS
eukprot:TRINITY_DN6511_c0_g1_i1.p1 TRINITY_DN6511_c0_g1~~TRINITY_DN6511_c0_g1_i1.p1  ORF type:complete len:454 (+),score=144.14 TRINITY_DN6511_c0_g1_i1:91-1362(+)